MKQSFSETGSNWRLRKNVKTCPQNKKLYLLLLSRYGHFHPYFNFACENSQVTAATCKCYCPLVVNLTITSPCTKTSRVSCENQSFSCSCENQSFFLFMWKPVFFLVHVKTSLFSCYFEMLPPLSKVIVFFCYFLRYDEVFLISLLNGCYHYLVFMHPVNGCSKSKLLVKVNFIKK